MKETANNVNEIAVCREGAEIASVARIATGLGISSAFWMTYQNHLDVFDRWRWQSGLKDRSLCECLDLYCARLPLDEYALGNIRDFLIETIRW